MAAGPIYPSSVDYGSSGNLFPYLYQGTNQGGTANAAPSDRAHGVVASLGSNATVAFRFPMPPTIPSGTLKLRALFLSTATSGEILYTVQDGTCPAGSVPSGVALTSETQNTLTWAAGDNDKYKEVKTPLSATPSADDMLVVAVTFNGGGSWTMAQIVAAIFSIIWE